MTLEDSIKKITRYQYLDFMRYPNIVAVGCGNKFIGGINTGKLCIQVFVIKKYHKSCLGEGCIPSYYQGIQTDVIEFGEIGLNRSEFSSKQQVGDGFSKRIRPVKAGYSIGPYEKGYSNEGTFGCVVTRSDGSGNMKFYILSNNHLLANVNKLPIGTPIIQPGDGHLMTDRIAKLSEFVPIKFSEAGMVVENYVDAAIAEIDSLNLVRPNIAFMIIPKGINTKPEEDDILKVSGAESGYNSGTIVAVSASLKIDYQGKDCYFVDQIISDIKCQEGDSGAMVLDNDNKVLGILFGGNNKYTYINEISHIQKLLNVNIFTQS